jgi:hypothetical protein
LLAGTLPKIRLSHGTDEPPDNTYFRILHPILMYVSAFKDITRRTIRNKLRIGDGMSQPTPQTTEVGLKIFDFAIEGERLGDVVVGDESDGAEVERLAPILVVGESWPAVGPTICGT